MPVVVANTGSGPLVISAIAITGRNAPDFVATTGFTFPVTVQPGNSVTMNVKFAPSSPWKRGDRKAKLKLDDNVHQGEHSLGLTGMGVTCAGPVPAIVSDGQCADADLDGFNDVWEDNGYIDMNNSGTNDAGDFVFPRQRPYIFSPVTKSGTGFGQLLPTVTDPTILINASTVVVTISSAGVFGTATFTYTVGGSAPSSPAPVRPVVDIGSNLRLMFYIPNFVAGDTYTFTAGMGSDAAVADKHIPNIFVQYDYMDWDTPGNACTTNSDCINAGGPGAQPNVFCHAGFCSHNHAPGDPLFRKVVDQFAAHGIRLYIDPVHQAVPHAQVITWNQQGDGTTGATALCAGYGVVKGNIATGGAVNFHDIKNRPGSPFALDPFRKSIFHYAVFSHFNTCLTSSPQAPAGNCNQCPSDRSTPSGVPTAGTSGLAEVPGNDFIISLAAAFFNPLGSVPVNPFVEGGVFMHELGHNLGLHHRGDQPVPADAPNYLSVMNGKYVFSGIQHSAVPGVAVSVESLRELNYSEHTLATLEESALDEAVGGSPLSAGYTGIIRFIDSNNQNGVGSESGPIDWTGNGTIDPFLVSVDLNAQSGSGESMPGYRDWDHTTGQSGAGGGACITSSDCRLNNIRQQIHDLIDPTVDPHEPCLNGLCQSLWLNFQGTPWGKADAGAERTSGIVYEPGASAKVLVPEINH